MKTEKKMAIGVSLWRRKKERKKKKKVRLTWLVSGRGSHECVFNYENVIGNWVMEIENT